MLNSRSIIVLGAISALLVLGGSIPSRAADGNAYALFDGRSLAGWSAENGCLARVEEGCILLESGDGWLRSDHSYSDFNLHIEWKALKASKYDAGIYLRAGREGRPFPKRGYQVNLQEGREGNIPILKGAISQGLANGAGQWNTFDIAMLGESISVSINGHAAYQVDGVATEPGYIGIQVEVPLGGQFLLRNIQVTELTHRPIFNGTDLAGWEGAGGNANECWQVENGVLTGLQKKGPWLRSIEQFADFNLRMEYRVAPGANSGIYVRVPKDGNHHRDHTRLPPAGFEVQLLDDSASKHAILKEYQYSGSVYDLAGATRLVSRPPGEWNTIELDCRKDHVTSIHNGTLIVDINSTDHPLLALRQLKGYLGLQNHGGGVSFRNIRVGPSFR